jgi:hypothetical protein
MDCGGWPIVSDTPSADALDPATLHELLAVCARLEPVIRERLACMRLAAVAGVAGAGLEQFITIADELLDVLHAVERRARDWLETQAEERDDH